MAFALDRIEQPGYEPTLGQLAASAAEQAPGRREQEPAYGIAARLPDWLAGQPPDTKAELVGLVRCRALETPTCPESRAQPTDVADEFTIERALAIAPAIRVSQAVYAGAPWLSRNYRAANIAPTWVPCGVLNP